MDSYDNSYVIDLRYAKSASDVIFEFSSILENELVKNKKIFLKLSDIELNQTQLQSIKSLINSINSNLTVIETTNVQTQQAALALGLIVEDPDAAAENAQNESPAPEETIFVPSEQQPEKDAQEKAEELIEKQSDAVSGEKLEEDDAVYDYNTEDISDAIKQNQKITNELDIIFDEEKKLEELLDHQPDVSEIERMLQLESEYTQQDFEIDNLPTMYLKQTLRSGQVINYEGNIVIIGDAHCGSEINAAGDITVWGILSGIAHAGSNGNEKARIRALKMNALQLRIADWYSRRPDESKISAQEKSNIFEPEEARVIDGVVVLFKINEKK